MPGLKHLLFIFSLIASVISSSTANQAPSRTFTVQAYESAQPNTSLTGYYLNADSGTFYLTKEAPRDKPVLSVDHYGRAFLSTGAKIFVDTTDGHLGYTAPSTPPGAIFSYFVHLGAGTKVFLGDPQNPQEPPSVFQWIDPVNNEWFACEVATGTGKYKLFKVMTNTVPNLSGCAAVELAALDYNK